MCLKTHGDTVLGSSDETLEANVDKNVVNVIVLYHTTVVVDSQNLRSSFT